MSCHLLKVNVYPVLNNSYYIKRKCPQQCHSIKETFSCAIYIEDASEDINTAIILISELEGLYSVKFGMRQSSFMT